ncbi:acyltransferase [Bifidobacterium sp. ESL0728]|uniref:acyltransferase n=1 Tax=Bifidobacterium sp. ESL0728 TaxID=2983220 RepID=UPI0023F8F77D|nr:acyltransferase [Bifidobacterium sp. ESL0728]WEV59327.1 acyltransferase [Bifidobacterium sp. ESL0728]
MQMKERDYSLDVIRIIAICLVVFRHSSSSLSNNKAQVITNTVGTLGVPLFVMLTGYLMVDREYDSSYIQRFLVRNLLPLFVSLEAWNILNFLHDKIAGINEISFGRMMRIAFFVGPTNSAFWFLPMILGIYLGIPIISIAIHQLYRQNSHLYIYLLTVLILFFGTVVPTAGQIFQLFFHGEELEGVINMNLFGTDVWGASCWILYLLAGLTIKKINSKHFVGRRNILWPSFSFIVSLALLIIFNLSLIKMGQQWSPAYSNIFEVTAAISLFVLMNRIHLSRLNKQTIIKYIVYTSQLSFSVYIIHIWILQFVQPLWKNSVGNGILAFLGSFIIAYLGSLIVGWILSKIRFVRKWLLLMK